MDLHIFEIISKLMDLDLHIFEIMSKIIDLNVQIIDLQLQIKDLGVKSMIFEIFSKIWRSNPVNLSLGRKWKLKIIITQAA